jgi:alpha-N-arabinofuranosidase
MRKAQIFLIPAGLAVSLCLCAQPAAISGGRILVAVDAAKASDPITKYLYGGFIEHLGNLINSNLWSEMLDDRKFYYPVNAEPVQTVPGGRGGVRRWRPVGPAASVRMDHNRPYAGEQTPVVNLDLTPHGMRQGGLALQKNKSYAGRIVIAGDPGATVSVRLKWGPNPADGQTISTGALHRDFAKVSLKFTSGANTDDGQIEIVGTGTGSFRVGAVSLMPADNLNGFRADAIALLKQMNSGFYRFPGGNFLSNHDWRNAIGDPDKRPPVWDYYWAALQPNDVGTDELLTMCDLLGVEPYISVNAGFGDARSAAELVEYTNGSPATPMGKLRAANGHPQPYRIKFWNIGNEAYGWWQFGHMVLNQYALKNNMFADAMRKVDPSITLIASRLDRWLTGQVVGQVRYVG